MATKPGIGELGIIVALVGYFITKYFGFTWALAAVVISVCIFIFRLYQKTQLWKRLGVPGPPPTLFFGNLREMFSQGIFAMDTKWTKTYGKVFGSYLFTQPELVIADVELLKPILVKDFHNFTNRRDAGNISEEDSIFAKMLTLIKDDEWKNVRSTVTPAFTSGKMKNMTHLLDDCVDTLIEILSEIADRNETFDAKEKFGACTMDVIAATAFGTKIDSQRNPDDLFVKYAKQVNTFSFRSFGFLFLILFPWTAVQLQRYFGIRVLFRGVEEFFVKSLTQLLENRRKNPLTDKPDFLQLLLNAAQESAAVNNGAALTVEKDDFISHDFGGKHVPLTTRQIMSQSFLFLVAGYETTAVTLTWIAYLLATHPEIQEKCYEEIVSVTGDKPITYNHIQHQLPYLDAVIAETLRLYPPAVRFDRHCKEDYELMDGITIPKDTAVNVAAYVIHHDEEHYPEPETFMPERFLPEEKARRNPLTYLPFGYGPRNCIGMRFAQMEMKLILGNLIRKFRLSPSSTTEPYPPKLKTEGLLRPLNPVVLNIEIRR